MFDNILLCTHETDGAQKAEQFVFAQMAANPEMKVTLLNVLDEDWLNSSKTQATFLDHVEEEASSEIAEEWQRSGSGVAAEWQRIKQQYPQAGRLSFSSEPAG